MSSGFKIWWLMLYCTRTLPSNYSCFSVSLRQTAKEPTCHSVIISSCFFLNQHPHFSHVNICKIAKNILSFCLLSITTFRHWSPINFLLYPLGQVPESYTKTLSWDLHKTGSGFGRGQGCRTWYLCVCLLSQYCILFRLPSGGTVSKKTRKEMGWKQRKRKGTQCDGACPSLILVQPESCGQWRHRCN